MVSAMGKQAFVISIILICFGVAGDHCLQMEKTVLPPMPTEVAANPPNVDKTRKPVERLPIGLCCDFGKIKFGKTAFRDVCIVNTADVPLRIVSVRAVSANHLGVTVSKQILEAGEQGNLEIRIDARLFVGQRTTQTWVETECGGKFAVILIRVSAESTKELRQ